MDAGDNPNIDADGPDFFRGTAVDTQARIQQCGADFVVHDVFEGDVDGLFAGCDFFFGLISGEMGNHGCMERIGLILAGGLVTVVQGIVEAATHPLAHCLFERLVLWCRYERLLGLATQGNQFLLQGTDFFGDAVAFDDTVEHLLFGQLKRTCLDHQDGVFGAGDDQVEAALLHGAHGRVDDQRTIEVADGNGTDRARERNARDGQGGRGGNNRTRTRIVDHINRKGRDNNLDFVEVALWEQRAQRPVGQSRRQNCRGGGSTFALEEAPGDFAGCVHFFFVIDGQWEEVDPLAGGFGGHHGGQQDGVTIADGDGTIGLLGEPTRFEGHGPAGDFSADAEYFTFCHGLLLLCHRVWQLPCVRYWRLLSAVRTPSSNP